ncbi:hypothetical protein [Metaplanococcus flavidus]|uniref:Uncharacterized protein n=1 Tax=Metaplanococcus flavidus TaxID=569883 RepID=A0ABW3LBS7_9BACL
MKQNTMFPNLIQKFITAEDVAVLMQWIGYEDTARKLTIGSLQTIVCGFDRVCAHPVAVSKNKIGHPDTGLITSDLSAHAVDRHLALALAGCIDDVSLRLLCAQQEQSVIYWLINTPEIILKNTSLWRT